MKLDIIILLEDEQLNDEDGGDNEDDDDADLDDPVEELLEPTTKDITTLNASELEKYLEDAIAMEDYERASRIRDEISKRKKS